MVVGWYHSHPGFGCWLSGVDINTQQVLDPLYVQTKLNIWMIFVMRNVDWNKNVNFKAA